VFRDLHKNCSVNFVFICVNKLRALCYTMLKSNFTFHSRTAYHIRPLCETQNAGGNFYCRSYSMLRIEINTVSSYSHVMVPSQ
jgi:hypothetical protein